VHYEQSQARVWPGQGQGEGRGECVLVHHNTISTRSGNECVQAREEDTMSVYGYASSL
jgi:hypothetical protein